MNSPQITPVTALQRSYGAVLKKLANGPVFLAQRSHPVAAILSIADYDRMTDELKRLRRIIEGDRHLAEIRAGNYTELPETTD